MSGYSSDHRLDGRVHYFDMYPAIESVGCGQRWLLTAVTKRFSTRYGWRPTSAIMKNNFERLASFSIIT